MYLYYVSKLEFYQVKLEENFKYHLTNLVKLDYNITCYEILGGDILKFTPKEARLLSGLTQQQVAQKLNIHPQTYAKLEKNPDMFTVGQSKLLSKLFGMDYDLIFFDAESNLTRVNDKQ